MSLCTGQLHALSHHNYKIDYLMRTTKRPQEQIRPDYATYFTIQVKIVQTSILISSRHLPKYFQLHP